VAELDSALNEWIDMVPNHRASSLPTNFSCPLNASTSQMGHDGSEL
jgi:hypothetical protein